MTVDEYLEALASAAATPGGGSAAASVSAHGAALIAMVARITLGSERFAAVHAQAKVFIAQADTLRARLRAQGLADEHSYAGVRLAVAMPKGTDEEKVARAMAREVALAKAAEAPLSIAESAAEVALLSEAALSLSNNALESDLLCAVEFALAGANAAAANVMINHRSMKDSTLIASQRDRLWKACNGADASCSTIRERFVGLLRD